MSHALRILLVATLVPLLAPDAGAALDDVCATVNLSKMPPSISIVPCLPPTQSWPLPVKVWVEGTPLP